MYVYIWLYWSLFQVSEIWQFTQPHRGLGASPVQALREPGALRAAGGLVHHWPGGVSSPARARATAIGDGLKLKLGFYCACISIYICTIYRGRERDVYIHIYIYTYIYIYIHRVFLSLSLQMVLRWYKYIIEPIWNFGKHGGKHLREIKQMEGWVRVNGETTRHLEVLIYTQIGENAWKLEGQWNKSSQFTACRCELP
jgi:hypothetical protein